MACVIVEISHTATGQKKIIFLNKTSEIVNQELKTQNGNFPRNSRISSGILNITNLTQDQSMEYPKRG